MNRLVAGIADLSPQQRAVLELRLRRRGRAKAGTAVERRPRTAAGVPLSFAQERLWFIQQMLPENTAYNVRNAVRLRGGLNTGVLARTLGEIVRRHEVLRSTFPLDGERPVQITAPWRPFPLAQVDLAGIAAERREVEAVRLAAESSSLPFDLPGGPVIRALHLRLAEQEHVILLTLHHIVADGWSTEILTRELATLYAAFSRGEPSPLPELPIQYADFALWQRDWLQGEVLEAQLAVWKRRLQGAPEVIELPTDRPRPSTQSFRGANFSFALPAGLQSGLRDLSRRQGTTLFMTVLAAFQLLLHRYTGQDDIVVGSPIAGRNRVEIENLIGCFVNTLVLRLSFAGAPTFLELLARAREVSLEAYAHQDLPFEKLVEELQPKRSLSHQPLFQVAFALDSSTEARSEAQGVALRPFEIGSASTKFDWVLMMQETRGGVSGSWSYSTDLFDRSSMARTLDHLITLLEGIVQDPGCDPALLPMLSAAERQQVVIEWNDTEAPLVATRFIHDLFAAQVESAPDAPAALTGGGQFTYREVDQRSNQLAHALRRLGVGPGASVAVLLERSLEMVPALLAILKTGGAYVPLEPIFGKARIHWILSALGMRWILTQTTQLPLLGELDELPVLEHVLCLDAALPTAADAARLMPALPGLQRLHSLAEISALPASDPRLREPAAEVAYTIYTSGSTGAPKGVQVCHRPVINLIDWVNRTFEVGPGDRLLFTTSLCFDLSVYDIFGILAAGGSIRIATGEEARDPERLLEILLREPITFWDSAPAALQQLVPFFPPAAGAGGDRLRLVFLSGDWIPVSLPDRVRAVFPRARVISLGGATEATVWSNDFPIGTVDPRWSSIPYGRPIRNARYHVLDPHLGPCTVRVPGELFIAGGCLSDGYAREPALTAQRYVPDPFSAEAGARMYRTGDRARLFPDGNIEFLGRLDHQVKIRGFRVELGDIEVTLRQHPAVRDVVVVARGDRPGDMRLIAYFVPGGGERPTASALRTFLQERLPAYMVPAAFVGLESFPVTGNGKLDRQGLPEVEWSRPDDGGELQTPRSPVEARLTEIWSQVLGVDKIGVHDNFFELGGDSILAIQMVSRANQAGLRLSVRQTFQYQTVAELAGAVGTEEEIAAEQGAVVGPVPLTPIQSWFLEQELDEPYHWNQSLLFEARDPQDPSILRAAVGRLLLHHDALRLRFARAGTGWRQECSAPDGAVPFHHLDLSGLPAELRARALEATAAGVQASLDLHAGPLIRVALFTAGRGTPDRLLLVIHHLAVDGLSWRVLLEDLRIACRQAAGGQPVRLPAKTSSFKEWSLRLAAHAESEELAAEAGYWLGMLPAEARPLPVDGPGGRNTVASLRSVGESLTAEETRALLQDLPAAFHTEINEVLLTALAGAFGRWTGEPRLLLDLEGHGREGVFAEVDVSRTVGWFTSIMPVHLELSPGGDLLAALRSVKEQLRRMPHRGARYGLLRHLCRDEAVRSELRRRAQPEVSFNYLGRFDQALPPGDSPFDFSPLSKGPDRSPAGSRRHLLEITARVVGGCLHVQLAYSEAFHRRSTVEELARSFVAELRALLALAEAPSAETLTASDFPLAHLDEDKLQHLSALIDAADGLEEDGDLG
ncbi:MAG: hypothetical protein QOH06_3655 [Acidobacteriota bacterium]|jgi:amino acid adenylation domain-containing protein/non-ribosomal peptide synthase protein (TIGR01720 family)|nr:hypothetical protein [Acidobacteriota bacterium]